MKVDLDTVESVLADHIPDTSNRLKIVQDIEKYLEEQKANREPRKKTKNQLIAVAVTDNEEIVETPLYVVQVPEDFDHNTLVPQIIEAAKDFNNSKKGRKNPVSNVGETFESVTRKLFKERGLDVKTKEPVIVVQTVNDALPNTETFSPNVD